MASVLVYGETEEAFLLNFVYPREERGERVNEVLTDLKDLDMEFDETHKAQYDGHTVAIHLFKHQKNGELTIKRPLPADVDSIKYIATTFYFLPRPEVKFKSSCIEDLAQEAYEAAMKE